MTPTGNLDSKNGDAVTALLRDLHGKGTTIGLVTHDARYARDAQRTIHLFDGRLVEDVALNQAPDCYISAS
jgi:putative ABC transport system ATP-binding protein